MCIKPNTKKYFMPPNQQCQSTNFTKEQAHGQTFPVGALTTPQATSLIQLEGLQEWWWEWGPGKSPGCDPIFMHFQLENRIWWWRYSLFLCSVALFQLTIKPINPPPLATSLKSLQVKKCCRSKPSVRPTVPTGGWVKTTVGMLV